MKRILELAKSRHQEIAIYCVAAAWAVISVALSWYFFGGEGSLSWLPIWVQLMCGIGLLTLCYVCYLACIWLLIAVFLTN